jgi:His-Xaa-Ser system protein HxsD
VEIHDLPREDSISVRIACDLVSVEALLKTCYWFSRDFVCDVKSDGSDHIILLTAKAEASGSLYAARERFISSAMDFSLRECVSAQTAGVRDLLLAKAFSESGVLEEQPQGIFGDSLEESRPDGMFKILSNG